MKRIRLALATILWVWVGGFREGRASWGGGPGAPPQQEPSQLGAQEEEQVARPQRDGTILLRVPTRLADLQLKSGRYQFQQRVDGGERLLQVKEVKRYALYKRGVHDSRMFGAEVKCRVEALGERATETAVHIRSEAGVARVEWVTLAGENGRCFLGAVRR